MEKHKVLLICTTIITLIVVTILLTLHRNYSCKSPIDGASFGQYGSFIGGIASLFAAVLLYRTLTLQRKGLEKQEEQYKKDEIENRYFELLKIQRENSMLVREKLPMMLHELYRTYSFIQPWTIKKLDARLSKEDPYNIAFLIFFYGTQDDIKLEIISHYLSTYSFGKELQEELFGMCKTCSFSMGYSEILGHYYRHLYHTVDYIDKKKILTYDEKKEYMRILRSQLSDDEQILFLWNSLSVLGKKWEKDERLDINKQLITKYNLIRNIPQACSKNINPLEHYPNVTFGGMENITPEKAEMLKIYA